MLSVQDVHTYYGDSYILQGVTLGGTGAHRGDRHPKVGKGVLLGANASVLGRMVSFELRKKF